MLSYDIKQGPILIGFRGNGSGHAIVGKKLLKNNRYLDEYRIEIYDNNYPGVYKNIEVEEYQDVDGKIQLLMDSKNYDWDEKNMFNIISVDPIYFYLKSKNYF